MSKSEREWAEGIVPVAEELVKQHSAEGAIERLQTRRQTSSEELQARCNEAIAYIRREVIDDQN